MTSRDRAFLRGQLATVGILLEPATSPSLSAAPAAPNEPPLFDRDEVRAIRVTSRAPADDLDWLVASCPSVDDARGYHPPARQGWGIDLGGDLAAGGLGRLLWRGG